MKILFYVGTQFLYSAGGAERVCCNLLNEMVCRGHQAVLVCNDLIRDKPFFSLDSEIRLYGLGKPKDQNYFMRLKNRLSRLSVMMLHKISHAREYTEIFPAYLKLQEIIDAEKPDFVLCLYYKSFYTLAKYGKFDIPLVLTHHSNPQNLKYRIGRQKKNLIDMCDAIHLLMPSYREEAAQWTTAPITTIANAIPAAPEEYFVNHLREKPTYNIVCISRLHKDKQLELLIDAFALLAPNYPHWNLLCYGDDKSPKYGNQILRQIERLGLRDRAFLPGRTPSPYKALSQGDIFAFPTKREGFPLALCEAMSVKLPSVGLKTTTGVNELLVDGYNGFLADASPEDFAAKLKILMDDPALRMKMGNNGLESMKKYAPQNIWNQWEDFLMNIAYHDLKKAAS